MRYSIVLATAAALVVASANSADARCRHHCRNAPLVNQTFAPAAPAPAAQAEPAPKARIKSDLQVWGDNSYVEQRASAGTKPTEPAAPAAPTLPAPVCNWFTCSGR